MSERRHGSWRRIVPWPVFLIALTVAMVVGCGGADPTATPTSAPAATATAIMAQAATPTPSPTALELLIKAADAEGEMNFMSGSLDTEDQWVEYEKGLNALFGTSIKMSFTEGPSFSKMTARVGQEVEAGQVSSSDIMIGSPSGDPERVDWLEAVDWRELSLDIPEEAIMADGKVLAFATRTPVQVAYNTNMVSRADVPDTLEKLMDPKWKGMIATTPYVANWDRVALTTGPERITQVMQAMVDNGNLVGLMRAGEMERIITGEFPIFVFAGVGSVQRQKNKGAPIDMVPLQDGQVITYHTWNIPVNSEHPNAAKLFAIYHLTREAQDILYKYELYDLHWLEGSKFNVGIEEAKAKGIDFTVINLKTILDNEDFFFGDTKAAWKKIARGAGS